MHQTRPSIGRYKGRVYHALARLREDRVVERIWAGDHTVWKPSPTEITNRLGWLGVPEAMQRETEALRAFAEDVRRAGFTRAILLGMGGSSLAPEVFRDLFGTRPAGPGEPPFLHLDVLDTTDASTVADCWDSVDPPRTLFLVSSKSGGTVETLSLFSWFLSQMTAALGEEAAGRHFVAITDPGSGLARQAAEHGFRHVFLNNPNIGGRYSALSHFGLVPAALLGVDLDLLLSRAVTMAAACRMTDFPLGSGNPGAWLGALLGEMAYASRDKLTLILPPSLASIGGWIEQLVAESTGKEGKGILPVVGEPLAAPGAYARDRIFVAIRLAGDTTLAAGTRALVTGGHPVVEIELTDRYDLGAEFFRWEFATAVACRALGVNPFDQPDVESAKIQARELLAAYRESGRLPEEEAVCQDGPLRGYDLEAADTVEDLLARLMHGGRAGGYLAVLAYLPPNREVAEAVEVLREALRHGTGAAVTTGFGPRFLHSTGQLHKGDHGRGAFLQLLGGPAPEVPIPEAPGSSESFATFDVLKRAQALGDLRALREAGRKVVTIDLGPNVPAGLARVAALAAQAAAPARNETVPR